MIGGSGEGLEESLGNISDAPQVRNVCAGRSAMAAECADNGLPDSTSDFLDARLVPLAETPQLAEGDTVPTGAGEPEHGSLDGGAVDGARASGAQNVAVEVGGAGRIGDFIRPSTLPYVTAPTDTYTRFFEGYRAAGGQDEERIDAMIQCESSWRLDPPGIHLGLAQFEVGAWATVSGITGYTDWRDPYSQGVNTATWASMVDPGSRSGWPTCFHAIVW